MLHERKCSFFFCLLTALAVKSRGAIICPSSCVCQPVSVQCENSVNFTGVPDLAGANDTLQSLLIAGAHIKFINTSAFVNFYQLKKLDLNNNEIETLADGAFLGLDKLQELILRRNYLRQLSDLTFQGLKELKVLELSWNFIVYSQADWFQYLGHLEVLDLARNKIEHIEESAFRGLDNLRTLNLSRNSLLLVSEQNFRPLGSLENLILDDNAIRIIENRSFSSLVNLKTLSLTGNRELMLLESEVFLSESGTFPLKYLSLKGTALKVVPVDNLKSLTELKTLDLSQTNISVIKRMSFSRLKHLSSLTLDSLPELNRIEQDAFWGLDALDYLAITNNKMLNNVSWNAFRNLNNLRYLSLRNNGLEMLHSGLADWQNIDVVDLRDNPLRCDCHAAWMLSLLKQESNATASQSKFASSDSISISDNTCISSGNLSSKQSSEASTVALTGQILCHMPPNVHGRCLASLQLEDFRCPDAAESQRRDSNDRRFKVGIVAASVVCVFLLTCGLFLKYRRRILSLCQRQYHYKTCRNREMNGGSPSGEMVKLEITQVEDLETDIDTSLKQKTDI